MRKLIAAAVMGLACLPTAVALQPQTQAPATVLSVPGTVVRVALPQGFVAGAPGNLFDRAFRWDPVANLDRTEVI
jgi:hypothetical protein